MSLQFMELQSGLFIRLTTWHCLNYTWGSKSSFLLRCHLSLLRFRKAMFIRCDEGNVTTQSQFYEHIFRTGIH
jgi:hypothetical protein